MVVAASSGVSAIGLLVIAVLLTSLVVSTLKGRPWVLLGLLFQIILLLAPIVAFRIAKPTSWWARRFYNDAKMLKARRVSPARGPCVAGGGVAPPNWYPDPYRTTRLRYWDGRTWTEHEAA
jgi:hypothetical protein